MIEIVPYCPDWPQQFAAAAQEIKSSLGDLAESVHHIGSTSVVGLAAKDIIDIQLTIKSFEPEIDRLLTATGFNRVAHISADHRPPGMDNLTDHDLYKWLFTRERPSIHLHIRKSGNYNQRYPLLCRDYLRTHDTAAKAYEQVKINLAKRFSNDPTSYYDIKDPVFDVLMTGAEIWAAVVNWKPGPSDI